MKRDLVVLAYLLAAVSGHFVAAAEGKYVRVSKDGVNIRTQPSASGEIVVAASQGDVFKLNARVGDWYEISMFSGEYRYIHSTLAEPTSVTPLLPESSEIRRAACFAMVRAQDRATAESQSRYPGDFSRRIDFERLLYDRYELPVFHEHGIPPARSATLSVECAKKNWIPN